MEKKNKLRNHISVIFENTMRTIGILFFIFVGNFVSSMDDMENVGDMANHTLYLLLTLIGILVLILGYQVLIWSKTYIYIDGNALIIERNTINKKKNTIGIKNISNVNLEQNLFEMIIGTCKVKLDTNSLSTADQTDVKIVLKKQDAEVFKQIILGRTEEVVVQEAQENEQCKYVSGMNDIMMHGIFSLNVLSVIALVGVVIGAIASISDMSLGNTEGGALENILSVLIMIWLVGGLLWNAVKGFVQYIDFRIERRGNKVYLNYGLLKKMAYSIPVDKINGVRFVQTGLARLCKRYMVEVIVVGLDDDENEAQSFFLPYAKAEKIEARMKMLLPEFDGCLEIQETRQQKEIWLIWLPAVLIYLAIVAVGFGVTAEFWPEAKVPFLIIGAIISALLLISKVASYFTKGIGVDEKLLKVVDGSFARRTLFVKYEKIQYITSKQNFIAKKFKLQKGDVHLLAAMKNQINELPYFEEEILEELKKRII